MVANVHTLFTLTPPSGDNPGCAMNVTCTCGKSQSTSNVRDAIIWFGSHCYTAALDRAIEILKS